jgi:serine/threonine protein kinase
MERPDPAEELVRAGVEQRFLGRMAQPCRLGRFVLELQLGRGGSGVVFSAFDPGTRRRCAVKLLTRRMPGAVRQFKSEFASLSALVHRNIVSLGELHSEQGRWFFSMELVEGSDFVAYSRRHRDERTQAASIRHCLAQLVEGALAIHDAGKLHGDLKPSNVLVDETGRVVIIDFGLARNVRGRRAHGIEGTPPYMAPEQAHGARATPASDWYAIGVILHQALWGGRCKGHPGFDTHRRSPHGGTRDAELARLCMDLLNIEPAARPSGREVLARIGCIGPLSNGGGGGQALRQDPRAGRGSNPPVELSPQRPPGAS